jgi:SAM-dependent methyltransferase
MAFAELKARHSVVWGNGPYERITNTIRDMHELVIERVDPQPGERVLDAATGTGAAAILAAKRGAEVLGQDIAPVLIETARERAAEEGVEVDFEVGDAEAMSYDDASFDIVTSTCGVMFAPDHGAIAGELARVTKPGGRLALGCWKPGTGMAEVFKMMGPFLPPPCPAQGALSPGGTSSTCGSCSATRSSWISRGTTPLSSSSRQRPTGSSSRRRTVPRRPQWKRSTRGVARSSTRRGSTSSRSTARATRSCITGSGS